MIGEGKVYLMGLRVVESLGGHETSDRRGWVVMKMENEQ